jgi:hypothetical protein
MAERTAISMASRSRRLDLGRPLKMTRSSWSTSRATSCRIVSAVFFLRSQRFLDGPQTTDLLADFHQFAGEFAEVTKLAGLLLGLAHGGRGRQGLGDGLAVTLVGETQAGSVTGIIRLGTVAVRFPTAPHRADDGAGTHVFDIGQGVEQIGAMRFQGGERVGHEVPPI